MIRSGAALAVAFRGRHLLAFDAVLIVFSYVAALALRFDAPSALFGEYLSAFSWVPMILLLVRITTFIVMGMYQRVWRFASIAELQAIVVAVFASSAIGYAIVFALGVVQPQPLPFPRSIPFVDSLLLLTLVGGLRFSFLILGLGRRRANGATSGATRTLIVGAGSAGVAVAKQLLSDGKLGLQIVGFVDNDETKGHRLLGVPVLGTIEQLGALIGAHGIGKVLFALPSADGPSLRRLVRIAEREGARSLTVPSISEIVTGQVSSALRDVQIDDLLRRAPAQTDLDAIRESFRGKTVLITGAGGSIGSELSRQLARYAPASLYLVGRGENSIYEVQEALRTVPDGVRLEPVILDVRDEAGVHRLMKRARPDFVFHAAAHKHVTFMERYPDEAVATNVFGTANVLAACEAAGVGSLVFVSTDKAVRPTSVMGATKRVGELLVRAAARRTGRRHVVVRFGNVLSSRGSVLPRFRRQLAEGGPITVTHPQARRFFMTVAEAVQLILQATVIGRPGDTFVLDMGEPVLIADLARDLIELHGLVPGRDVQITYTGLLPGEKIDEELFLPEEHPRVTVHQSIWAAEDTRSAQIDVGSLERLRATAAAGERDEILRELERLVPEYRPAPWSAALTTALRQSES